MIAERICDVCEMPYDWPGVTVDGVQYCCPECAHGEACVCPQHEHPEQPGDADASSTTGLRDPRADFPAEPRTSIP